MINEGPNDPNIFKIVFMAGTPGAGKSTVSKHIKAGTGLKMVNLDDLYEYLKNRKKQDVDFGKVDKLLTNQINTYIDGRLGMIVDKTGQDYGVVSKMKKVFESLGYQTSMVFVNTPLEIAKKRVLKRSKEIGRDVDPDYIEKAYANLIQNLGKYQNDFGNNLIIVDNKTGIDVKALEKNVRKFLSEPITHVAKQWVDGYYKDREVVKEDYKGQHKSPDKESGSPLHDVTQNDIYPDDFYSSNGLRYYAADAGAGVYHSITHLHNKPNAAITVYRSIPKSVKGSPLNVGDWVAISRAYAKEHGKSHLQGEFKIIKKKVFARDLFTDGNSLEEWGYDPQPVDMIARYKGRIKHITNQIERIKNGEKIIMINKREDDKYYGKEADAIKSMMNSVKSYAQQLKDETKDLISEDYPVGFSMEEFNAIRSYRGKMKYAAERLKRLGVGSSRVVYQIDNQKVLKLAKNEKGLAQNEVETDGYFHQMDITANVFDYDDKHDRPYWIEMELAVPIGRKVKKLENLLGLSLVELNSFLQANNPNQRNPEMFKGQIPQERMDELWEHEYASELIDLVGNIDMEVGDLIRPSSWGSIKRGGKEVPVLIDFGFTNNVRAHYYAR